MSKKTIPLLKKLMKSSCIKISDNQNGLSPSSVVRFSYSIIKKTKAKQEKVK